MVIIPGEAECGQSVGEDPNVPNDATAKDTGDSDLFKGLHLFSDELYVALDKVLNWEADTSRDALAYNIFDKLYEPEYRVHNWEAGYKLGFAFVVCVLL